jgi:hypothetical protein
MRPACMGPASQRVARGFEQKDVIGLRGREPPTHSEHGRLRTMLDQHDPTHSPRRGE